MGSEGATHPMNELFEEYFHNVWREFLIDAENAFNLLNRMSALTPPIWIRCSWFLIVLTKDGLFWWFVVLNHYYSVKKESHGGIRYQCICMCTRRALPFEPLTSSLDNPDGPDK